MHILHADDEQLWRGLIRRILEGLGHTVTSVESGEELLEMLGGGTKFDVVITDNNMKGGLYGLQVLQAIRAQPRFAKMPVIVLSGDDGIRGEVERADGVFIGKTERLVQRLPEEFAKFGDAPA